MGDAYSAAANILAFGYYAYAYRHSVIHFHGVRTRELLIARLVYRYQVAQSKFKPGRYRKSEGILAELRCFLDWAGPKVSSRTGQLLERTYQHVKNSHVFSTKIVSSVTFTKRFNFAALAAEDSRVLQAVIKHELRQNRGKQWRIDERGISQIVSDYFIIREYNFGEHIRLQKNIMKAFGVLFLNPTEQKQYHRIKKDEKKRSYLERHALPRLAPLWFFMVSLCNFLMEGESRLTPTDAYYIGAVDEVIGTKMTGRRAITEKEDEEGD